MKRLLCVLMCFVFIISLCACNKEESGRSEYSLLKDYEKSDSVPDYDFTSGQATAPEEYEAYTQGAMQFSFDLLAELSKGNTNAAVSTLSLSSSLSMLLNGAQDNTEKEMRKTLAGVGVDYINAGIYYLNSRIQSLNSQEDTLIFSQALWFNDSFDVRAEFLQTAINYYKCEAMRLSLGEENSKDEINNWISDSTDGAVENLVDEIDEKALLLITDAAVFCDDWMNPYNKEQIEEGVFHGASSDRDAEFMVSQAQYITSSYADGFVKDFKNLPLRFAALLPKEGMTVEEFSREFTALRWQELLASQQGTSFCKVSMPSFKAAFEGDISEILKNMGIKTAFNEEKSDFSHLSNTGKPYLSSAMHSTSVTIGPLGAKGGDATLSGENTIMEGIPEVTFDRPFVFVIYDNESGVPVFVGVVNQV